MWGEELEIDNALRGDVGRDVGRARLYAGGAVLVALAVIALAALFLAQMGNPTT
jgi:hypothetical protein